MAQPTPGGVSQQGMYGYYSGTGVVDTNPEHAADEAGAGGSMSPGESDERTQSAQAGGDVALQHMERGIAEPYGMSPPYEHAAATKEDLARNRGVIHGGNR